MDCQRCGAANDATARFCDQCGGPLAATCPSCGAANRPEARFCGTCGSAIRAATDTPSAAAAATSATGTEPTTARTELAERRLVSVLFADLVGFTPFAEARDPEAVRELLSGYFERTQLIVERHGGTVEKFIGDAVMAAWGTPVAHEDDAERAVRAGLEIVTGVRSLGDGLEARVGVLTGEAAVNLAATNEGMVAGDLVNTAARLQSVAPPGAVLVGEATMRAVGEAIAFEPVGEQQLKGKATTVPAWRAVRVVAERGTGSGADLLEPPFVGRDDELALLKDLLHATGRDRRPRLVSVTGPAGIGKSRLASELGRYVDGLVEDIYWHRGRSPSYGEGITFWALGEMIRQRAGLAESDDEPTTRAALARMLAEHVPDEADRRWVEPGVMTLLGLEPPPAGGRDVLFAAWRILFERIAAQGTTVLLFEDLHWADGGLLDFIDHLLATVRDVPLLVVTLARPELFDRRPDWMTGRRDVTGVALQPLSEPAMRELLTGLVPGLPEATVRAVLARADGIPMYAVETVRALVTDGRLERSDGLYRPVGDLSHLRVPETLQSLIGSRLDALDPIDRGLLQDGAVLGQTFTAAALAAIAGMAPDEVEVRLRGLVRRELLRVDIDPRSPERGQHGFVQSLVREVAYSTLARRDRRARHLAVARYYEALDDPELAGALASHYLAAQQASAEGPEADALAVQARRALRAAAERAIDLGADDQAATYLDQALSITIGDLERGELLELAGIASLRAGHYEHAIAQAMAAGAAYRAAGDPSGVMKAADLTGLAQIEASQLREAKATLTDALGEIAAHPSHAGDQVRAKLEARLSRVLMRLDERQDAIEAADRALAIAERDRLETVVAEALINKGSALGNAGRWREGSALLEAAAQIAARIGDVSIELRARNNLASVIWFEEPTRALAMVEEALEVGRRIGPVVHNVWTAMTTAYGEYYHARDWDRALALVDEFLDDDLSPSDRGRLLGARITIEIDRGDVDEAAVHETEAIWQSLSDPDVQSSIDSVEAQIATVGGRFAEGFDRYLHAASVAAQSAFGNLAEGAYAALLGRDADRARQALALLDELPDTSRLVEGTRGWLRAGIDAIEGRTSEAQAGFRVSIRQVEDQGWWWSRTMLTAVVLLPPTAETRAWADAAREVFEHCRARPYLAMLDQAVAAWTSADIGGGAPSSTRASSAEAPVPSA